MPLEIGCSKAVRSRNIRKLVREGYPRKQAVAIALKEARKYRKMCKHQDRVLRRAPKKPKAGVALRRRAMRIAYPGRGTGGWDPWVKDSKVDREYNRLLKHSHTKKRKTKKRRRSSSLWSL